MTPHLSSKVLVMAVFVLAVSPAPASAQPEPYFVPSKDWAPEVCSDWFVDSVARELGKILIRRDSGVFVDKLNGNVVQTRTLDTTSASRDNFTYRYETAAVEIGWATCKAGKRNFVATGGAFSVGTTTISNVDRQQQEIAYKGPAGPAGFRVGGTAGRRFGGDRNTWVISAGYDYERLQDGNAARTPALTVTGGTVPSEQYKTLGQFDTLSATLAYSRELSVKTRIITWGGSRYLWGDMRVDRQATIDFGQGRTSEFTGRTELTARGAFVALGGGMQFRRGSIFAEIFGGKQSGFKAGGSWRWP